MSTPPSSPTATHLREAIEATEKTQREIAENAGLPHPNVLSMMKLGETKVPIPRIPALSAALGIDAATFIDIAMREYNPDTWATLVSSGIPLPGSIERNILDCFHNATFGQDLPWSDALAAVLDAVFELALEAAHD